MAIQIEDIINKEFSRSFLGYDMQEVDVFLDALIDRFEKLETQRREMIIAMEYLLKKLEDRGDLPSDVKRALANSNRALRRLAAALPDASDEARQAADKFGRSAKRIPDKGARKNRQRDSNAQAEAEARRETRDAPTIREGWRPSTQEEALSAASTLAQASATAENAASPVTRASPGTGLRAAVRVGGERSAQVHASASTAPVSTPASLTAQPTVRMETDMGETGDVAAGAASFETAVFRPAAMAAIAAEAILVEPDAVRPGDRGTSAVETVAIEMETHECAPEMDKLIPELLCDLEAALSEGAIRAASATQRETPVRSADEGSVS